MSVASVQGEFLGHSVQKKEDFTVYPSAIELKFHIGQFLLITYYYRELSLLGQVKSLKKEDPFLKIDSIYEKTWSLWNKIEAFIVERGRQVYDAYAPASIFHGIPAQYPDVVGQINRIQQKLHLLMNEFDSSSELRPASYNGGRVLTIHANTTDATRFFMKNVVGGMNEIKYQRGACTEATCLFISRLSADCSLESMVKSAHRFRCGIGSEVYVTRMVTTRMVPFYSKCLDLLKRWDGCYKSIPLSIRSMHDLRGYVWWNIGLEQFSNSVKLAPLKDAITIKSKSEWLSMREDNFKALSVGAYAASNHKHGFAIIKHESGLAYLFDINYGLFPVKESRTYASLAEREWIVMHKVQFSKSTIPPIRSRL